MNTRNLKFFSSLLFLTSIFFITFSCDNTSLDNSGTSTEQTQTDETSTSTETSEESDNSDEDSSESTKSTDSDADDSSTDDSTDSDDSQTTEDSDETSTKKTETAENISSGSIRMYKVSGTSITIDTEDDAGKTVYMAKLNTSTSSISSQYYVSSASGLTLNKKTVSSGRSALVESGTSDSSETTNHNYCGVIDITDKLIFNLDDSANAARTASSSAVQDYSVGDTRNFYTSDDDYNYSSKSATLLAKTDDVYVWVIDEDANPYVSRTEQKEFTEEMAQIYAEKMQEMYKYITNVYTALPEKLIYSSDGKFTSQSIVTMESVSKTGTKINIIVTDCSEDNSASSVSGGVVGFTSSVDLMASDSGKVVLSNSTYYSNMGNFFYLDNYWAVANQDDSISTLAHEFQHLLAFGYKWVDKNLSLFDSYETVAYGEMMSMLCEDIMQDFLELDDINAPIARLPYYNANYSSVGILDYDSSSTKLLSTSYAGAYAFGAWLAREFGGTELINQMANNAYVGMESVLAAIKTVKGQTYTEEDLIKLYLQVLINKTADETSPSLNKTAETNLTYNGYTYPLKAIDLWNLDECLSSDVYKNSSVSYSFDGPEYYASNTYSSIPSNGFTLHEIGTINSDQITLTLSTIENTSHRPGSSSSGSASKLDYYILIQD